MGLLLSPDHSATLLDPETWHDNPFVARDTRRDIKKRQPFVAFCWMCGILFFVAPWTASLIWAVQNSMKTSPLLIGGDLGTGLCVVISGIQIWFIIGASRKHTTRQFTQESNQNTLSSLLMLPASPFQILVQSMVYPWRVAMRLAIALLPVYVFCAGIDGPSWAEILALYLVFAMAALSVPFWTRPALSENAAILAPPRQFRFGLSRPQSGVGTATTSRSLTTSGSLALGLFAVPLFVAWLVVLAFGGMTAFKLQLHQYLPYSIISLTDSVVVSWPFLSARILITPLDWFGMKIVPVLFVLPLFLGFRYSELVRASEFLSVGAFRDLPLQATYRRRLILTAALRFTAAVVVIGYLWKWLVVNGALGWLSPPITGADPGLGGFAVLLLGYACIRGYTRGGLLGQWHLHPLIRGERYILCRNSFLDGLRYLAEPLLAACGMYLLCCLLGRENPSPAVVGAVSGSLGANLLQAAVIGFAGAVLSYGAARLLGPAAIVLRFCIPVLVFIGIFYSESQDVRQWLASFPAIAHGLSFVPHLRSLQILSPSMGIAHVLSGHAASLERQLPGAPGWYAWAATSLAIGGVFALCAHLIARRRHADFQDSVVLVFNPTVVGREVFSDPTALKHSGVGRADTPIVVALIGRLQRLWDNAVATRELRSRLRGRWERSLVATLLAFAAASTIVAFHPGISAWPTIFGGGIAWALMGSVSTPVAMTAAGILGCWYLVLFIAAFCNAFSTTGAFYAETQKSTLGFLLSTPMQSRSIVLGKALGILGPSLGILSVLSAWTLLLSLLFLPLIGPTVLTGWLYAVGSALTFYLMVNAITFAISALFPKLSMSGSAWIWVLLFWFGGGPIAWIYGIMVLALMGIGLQGASLWCAFVATGWVVIVLAYLVSVGSITSMRRRDLAFATSKRNN